MRGKGRIRRARFLSGAWNLPRSHASKKDILSSLLPGSLVLVLKLQNCTKIWVYWHLFLLEHNHWATDEPRRHYWPGDLRGFDSDHDLFEWVHQTVLLWAVLVYTPYFRHLLHQSGHPWSRVSPSYGLGAKILLSTNLKIILPLTKEHILQWLKDTWKCAFTVATFFL